MNGRTAPARSFAWRLRRQYTKIITPTAREDCGKRESKGRHNQNYARSKDVCQRKNATNESGNEYV